MFFNSKKMVVGRIELFNLMIGLKSYVFLKNKFNLYMGFFSWKGMGNFGGRELLNG
jgi:hypothetical protein